MSCTAAETSTTVLSPFSTPSLKSSKYRIFMGSPSRVIAPRCRSGLPARRTAAAYTALPRRENGVVRRGGAVISTAARPGCQRLLAERIVPEITGKTVEAIGEGGSDGGDR